MPTPRKSLYQSLPRGKEQPKLSNRFKIPSFGSVAHAFLVINVEFSFGLNVYFNIHLNKPQSMAQNKYVNVKTCEDTHD